MLTIKKRYPMRKLYIYGSSAIIVGFAGVMAYLVQSSTNLNKFVAVAPTQPIPVEVTSANEEPAQPTTSEVEMATGSESTGAVYTAPQSPVITTPAPTQSSEQPAATPTAPAEQPSQPTTPPEETPAPEDPTIIDEIIEIITPTP